MCSISGNQLYTKFITNLCFQLFGVLMHKYVCRTRNGVKENRDMIKIIAKVSNIEVTLTKKLVKVINKVAKHADEQELDTIIKVLDGTIRQLVDLRGGTQYDRKDI